MKVVILAGGFGTRIGEETVLKPKPMVEIGGYPILWHIMKIFSKQGFNDFIICAGYKQHVIKEFFADYFLHTADVTFDFTEARSNVVVHHAKTEPWKVTVVDTGYATMTGGRVKRIKEYIGNDSFLLTYGDGVADIDVNSLVKFHNNHGKTVTISAYNAEQRFGVLDISEEGCVREMREKAQGDGGLINIGFMVCNPNLLDYIEGDDVMLEKEPLSALAARGELVARRHDGFWQCMDTIREMKSLEKLWSEGKAPWKIWED
ncbi:MAG: glucose-1-phosphate cytidylyltransferase [Kiritimatiellae bacterium]|jgi:glucose-1-phosphate cytidylyltransferase|nr:glucose-1-phosphate cytidylyltransferase [Kiritimatiellia bacterium]